MLISTKGRYALTIMEELAQFEKGCYMPLPMIAEKQGISEKYLQMPAIQALFFLFNLL